MKKLIFSLCIVGFSLTFLSSCSKEDNNQVADNSTIATSENEVISYGGLKVKMRKGHSINELSMNISNYKQILFSNSSTLKSLKELESYSFDDLAVISCKVVENYPRIDSIDYNEIREDFIELSDDEIISNISVIDSFYNSLMTYNLIKEIAKTEQTSSKSVQLKSSYLGYDLSSEEFWVLVKYPRIISDAKAATKAAIAYTNTYFPGSSQYQDKADAFRHSIWNAFLGKAASPYKEWSYECCAFARELTNAHEAGSSKPADMTDEQWTLDKNMDLHNNGIGRDYFYEASHSYKRHWYSNRYVRCPSRDEMAAAIYSKYIPGAVKVAYSWQPTLYPSNLVFIK